MNKDVMTSGSVLCLGAIDDIRKGDRRPFSIVKNGNRRTFMIGEKAVKPNIFSAYFQIIDIDQKQTEENIVRNKIIKVLSERDHTIGAVEQIMSIFKAYKPEVSAGKVSGS